MRDARNPFPRYVWRDAYEARMRGEYPTPITPFIVVDSGGFSSYEQFCDVFGTPKTGPVLSSKAELGDKEERKDAEKFLNVGVTEDQFKRMIKWDFEGVLLWKDEKVRGAWIISPPKEA